MTALATPPPPIVRPRPGDASRVVTVFANLLPDEVVAGRRLRTVQRNIVFGLAGLLILVIAAYGLSYWQTADARSDLTAQQQRTTGLNQQMTKYQPLLAAQARAASISQTLSGLMVSDLSWRNLVNRLESQTHGNVTITGFNGALADPAAAQPGTPGSSLALLNDSGKQIVGTLTVTGTAADKRSLAAFVDRLDSVRGITVPLPASVMTDTKKLSYTINALITNDALGGRFTTTPGGK